MTKSKPVFFNKCLHKEEKCEEKLNSTCIDSFSKMLKKCDSLTMECQIVKLVNLPMVTLK